MISFWQAGVKRGAIIAVLGVALLGCSNTQNLPTETNAGAKVEALKFATAEEFTTKGKPTKTIETPWGPREIYDPSLKAEFSENYERMIERYLKTNSEVDYYTSRQKIQTEIALQDQEIVNAGCKVFKRTNNCVASMRDNEIISTCYALDYDKKIGKMQMKINGTSRFENAYSSSGHFFSSQKIDIAEIFEFECLQWKKED